MTSFVLKLIAAITMLIDHTGLILFPNQMIFRIIGRLAFPIYAYCIAEGFRYTRNRFKYFLRIFLLGLFCQIVYTIVSHDLYIGILLVFSISIIIMTFTDCVKTSVQGKKSALSSFVSRVFHRDITNEQDKVLSLVLCCASIMAAFVLCIYVDVDYSFFGISAAGIHKLFQRQEAASGHVLRLPYRAVHRPHRHAHDTVLVPRRNSAYRNVQRRARQAQSEILLLCFLSPAPRCSLRHTIFYKFRLILCLNTHFLTSTEP